MNELILTEREYGYAANLNKHNLQIKF